MNSGFEITVSDVIFHEPCIAFAHNLSSKLLRVANPHVSDVLIEKDILMLPFCLKRNKTLNNEMKTEDE